MVGGKAETGDGPRAAYVVAVVFFVLAAWFLRSVDPRKRDVRLAAEASATAQTGSAPATATP